MSGKPAVCIQICAWNVAPYIRQTLASAFQVASEVRDVEILYRDDASDDGSFEIAKELARANPALRCVRADRNEGIAVNTAKALLDTEAEFILKLDGDDILLPGHLAGQLSLMRANPELGAVYGKRLVTDGALHPKEQAMGMPFSHFNMAFYNAVSNCGILLRRDSALKAGGYRPPLMGPRTLGEDFDMYWRLSAVSGLLYVDKFMSLYRQHPGQFTRVKTTAFKENHEWMKDGCLASDPALAATLKDSPETKVDERNRRKAMLMLGVFASRAEAGGELYGRYAKAACSLTPSDYGASLALFSYYARAGRFDEALDVCRPMAIDPDTTSFVRMKAAEAATKLLLSLGRRDEARQWAVIASHFQDGYMRFDIKGCVTEGFAGACGIPR